MHYEFSKQADQISENGTYIIGFGFDGTASFRKGTKYGPAAIREVSDGVESYSPYFNEDICDYSVYDLGDVEFTDSDDVEKVWEAGNESFLKKTSGFNKANHRIITVGGEHSISYVPIKKYLETYEDLVLLHLDAHADLRDGFQGFKFSHASIIRRVLDHFGPSHELIQYGIRSGTKEEFEWMKEHKTRANSLNEFIDRITGIDPLRPVYLTFDLDYFDPSVFPGTGTPEPGGEDFHSFIKINKVLSKLNLVGADITELSPELDSSDCSSVVATKVLRELLLTLEMRRNNV